MLCGNVADQLLNKHGLAHTGAAKQADFAPLGVGSQQVNDFDARLQNFHAGALLCKAGSLPVNGPLFLAGSRPFIVNGVSQHVKHAAQRPLAHRHLDGTACRRHRHSPSQALAGGQGDAPHCLVPQMLEHFQHLGFPVVIHREGIVNFRQFPFAELYIHHRSQNL